VIGEEAGLAVMPCTVPLAMMTRLATSLSRRWPTSAREIPLDAGPVLHIRPAQPAGIQYLTSEPAVAAIVLSGSRDRGHRRVERLRSTRSVRPELCITVATGRPVTG